MSKNILFVGSYPPPFGGVSSLISQIGPKFIKKGYKMNIISFESKKKIEIDNGIKIFRKKNNINFKIIFFLLKNSFLIYKCLKKFFHNKNLLSWFNLSILIKSFHVLKYIIKFNPSSVTVFTTRLGFMIPYLKILNQNLKINYCIFADPYKNPDFYKVNYDWYRECLLSSNVVLSSSNYCANSVKNYAPEINTKSIYIGVDLDRFNIKISLNQIRENLSLPNKPIVLFLARMEKEMGVENALEIAKKVIDNDSNIVFVIAGAYGKKTKDVKIYEKKYQGRLFCRVNVSYDDLPHYFASADILIAPTVGNHACMGVSIKEAMATGLPSIVSNSGGIPEAIRNNREGIIVPLNQKSKIDNQLFCNSIINLIYDEKKLKFMKKNSKKRVKELFDINSTFLKYLDII